ncbi:MAG: Fpg/Nei family DNA glycosylase [Spirochaetia bacterium]
MPELPDLHFIVTHLAGRIENRRIDEIVVKEPIVIRMLLAGAGGFVAALQGRRIESLARRGPFLAFGLSDNAELIVHCMLAGRLQIAAAREKPVPHLCFSLRLDNGEWLRYGDDKRMGKVYLTAAGSHESIPGYDEQGVDVLSGSFTFEMFEKLIRGRRHQARVFLMDQTALSAIGNAYADEILFTARIHPKTACSSLTAEQRRGLYDAIRSVLEWGIAEVEKAGMPIEVKVRDHMQVRGRKDQPCPRCGSKIRRAGVLGYDSFYCPSCQPATRKQPIQWDTQNPPSTSARKET